MNKFVASVSLVALGAASVRAQYTPTGPSAGISGPTPKWWNIAATVRGFYDDNADTSPNGSPKVQTFGYELTPAVGLSIGNQQTTFSAGYVFDYLYYEKPLSDTFNPQHNTHAAQTKHDETHTFTTALDHAFSERYAVHASDSFVIGQQPDALRSSNPIQTFQRIPGNNIVNAAGITFDGVLTPLLGFEVGYKNGLYDYSAEQLSGPLNRDENYANFDLRWTMRPDTVGILGYQFGDVIYTGTGPFANPFGISSPINTINKRDTMSHTFYVGADHTFTPKLLGSVRAGASYYDYYNDTGSSGFGPYAQASLAYTYAPESSFSIGFQEGRIASSLTSTSTNLIHDTETSVLYGSVVHRIVPHLFGTVKGTFQNSNYHGGGPGVDGKSDRYYEVGAELDYKFNQFISVDAGYDYNSLGSGVATGLTGGPRDYDRNRFYIGATASY